MFKSFMPQKGFDLLRFHFIQEGKERKQAREAEQRSQWRFLLGVFAAVTNIFSPARDQ